MCNELNRELYKSEVLGKYVNDPAKYTVKNDNFIAEGNAWMIKYYRNPSDSSKISVLNGDIPEGENEHWNRYRIHE